MAIDFKLIFDSYFRGSNIPEHIEKERLASCSSCKDFQSITNTCGLCGCPRNFKVKRSNSVCAYFNRPDFPVPRWTATSAEHNQIVVYNSTIKEENEGDEYKHQHMDVVGTNTFRVISYQYPYFRIGISLLIKSFNKNELDVEVEKPDHVDLELVDGYNDFYVYTTKPFEDFTVGFKIKGIKLGKNTLKKEFKINFTWDKIKKDVK